MERTESLFPRGVNLNTVAIIVGFLSTLTAITWSYANLTNKQDNFVDFVVEQKTVNAKTDERFSAADVKLSVIPVISADLARIDASNNGQDERMGRMSENAGNQFSDIRTSISQLNTQAALIKQSLDRIEAWSSQRRQSSTTQGQP